MKFLAFVTLFIIASCVASTEIESLLQLTKDIDRVLPQISMDVFSALNGEINDIVNGNSPLVSDLKSIINELQTIHQSLPDGLKSTAGQVFHGLKQLDVSIHTGDFLSVDRLITSILANNEVFKSNI